MHIITKTNKINDIECKEIAMYITFFTDNDISFINRIIICTENNYEQTINEMRKDAQITKSERFNGFGKTIIYDEKQSDIFIREEIILGILNNIVMDNDKITIADTFPIKCLLHEIGHSFNNSISGEVIFKKEYSWSTTPLNEYLNYHYLIEKDEY